MFNFKRLRTALITMSLTMVLLIAAKTNVFAATYTVAQGDSLYQIGSLYNTTADAIKRASNISNDMIYPGEVLNVPSDTYTVKAGDTLYLISKQFGVSVGTIRVLNNKWDDNLYVGQRLVLPVGSTSQAASSQSGARPVVAYTQSDVGLLARLITAEAVGQPYSAKVAVGAVVINRIKSGQFPSTISGVIYQRINGYYQFTPVLNGWINKPATSDAINAAYAALYGSDPSHGALFYFDDSNTNAWLWSKPITARIANMVFVK